MISIKYDFAEYDLSFTQLFEDFTIRGTINDFCLFHLRCTSPIMSVSFLKNIVYLIKFIDNNSLRTGLSVLVG